MNIFVMKHGDVYRRALRDVAIGMIATVPLTWLAYVFLFGNDPAATVSSAYATTCVALLGTLASLVIGGSMSLHNHLLQKELRMAQAELLRISRIDQLTGLLNRRGFSEIGAQALAEAYNTQTPAVALMLDIDRFKRINDLFGHDFGDAVLIEIGEVLNNFAKKRGLVVSRHGGEEFAALLVGESPDNAFAIAEQLRRACAQKEVVRNGTLTKVTVSIGLAAAKGSESLSKVLSLADEALYRAKHGGRDRVSVHGTGGELLPAS
ncbi:GGDEF domain-containing protein [Bradyrhizobium liaoningense]|uniref:GGDEF domain-containing protein n=1 Tax=Bradyrhizobium liaoningense TaxID=43992 RepID=UPI001BADAA3E|nr:GGDEF domain-containing protein [Bradyrhizobium liaoningense]MBR0706938.1 GGDEF domain-containing protein [Bradyrhizobium liaoningense]